MSTQDNDPTGIDPELLKTLTPEEREAMGFDDAPEGADREALQRVASLGQGDAGDDDDGDDGDDGDAAAAPPPPAPPPKQDGAPGADDAAAAEAAAAAAAPPAAPAPPTEAAEEDEGPVQIPAELPKDYDERVKAVDTRESELEAKYDAGEVDAKTYRTELRAIEKDRRELDRIQSNYDLAQQQNKTNADLYWRRTINRFVAAEASAADGVDYRKDNEKAQAFDTYVRALGNDPANDNKSPKWFLEEANRLVRARFGLPLERKGAAAPTPAPATAPTPAQAAAAKKDAAAARRQDTKAAAAASLAQVPGGEGPGDIGGDEFADVDALEGQELEDAIAAMSPAQREKYKNSR